MKTAIYARYSTDKQSESSIEDQLRECRRLAERHDFIVTAQYADRAVSGGTARRPEYQRMLSDARAGRFDVIVAEDTSRLWRNLAEQAPRLAELQDLGIHVVTHDLDTRTESAGLLSAVNGAMSAQYRAEIARRTRRGLEGLAHAKRSTGGKAYGYISATDSDSGEREVNPAQAPVVVRIFEMYADGLSPRAIAEQLNAEGVPSPGAFWNRVSRRKAGWAMSAIAGDPKKGTGILNNQLYCGRVIWNRFKWIRSASDSSKRKRVQNPESEWIVYEDARLRIVPQDLWDRVKARQQAQSETIGERIRQGLPAESARHTGRSPKYLFSTLLKCSVCGTNYSLRGKTHYACGRHLDGRACSQTIGVKRSEIEPGLLAGIKRELLSDDAVQAAIEAAHRVLRESATRPAIDEGRIKQLRAEIDNLTDAIACGALRSSRSLADRLARAEKELTRLEAAAAHPTTEATAMIPRLADEYRGWVSELEAVLSPKGMELGQTTPRDISRARAQLRRRLGGAIVVRETDSEIRFETEASTAEIALKLAISGSQENLVAGASTFVTVASVRRYGR